MPIVLAVYHERAVYVIQVFHHAHQTIHSIVECFGSGHAGTKMHIGILPINGIAENRVSFDEIINTIRHRRKLSRRSDKENQLYGYQQYSFHCTESYCSVIKE